jgi:ribosomal-protein-alanine N-acetyltransferase
MKGIIETERLYFREFTLEDSQLLIDLNSNPNVIRYVGDGPVKDLMEAEIILKEIIFPQYINGMGRWAVHLKANDEFIGWCGLKYVKESDEIDLGYRFFEEHWGKGYATEAAKAVINYGVNVLKLQTITATGAKANVASIQVLKKIGMRYLQDELCKHDPAEKYVFDSVSS